MGPARVFLPCPQGDVIQTFATDRTITRSMQASCRGDRKGVMTSVFPKSQVENGICMYGVGMEHFVELFSSVL